MPRRFANLLEDFADLFEMVKFWKSTSSLLFEMLFTSSFVTKTHFASLW